MYIMKIKMKKEGWLLLITTMIALIINICFNSTHELHYSTSFPKTNQIHLKKNIYWNTQK